MQITSMIALLFTVATGALAAPGHANGLSENYWKCSDLNNVCNDVIVCCNNNSNNNNQQGKQNNIDTGSQSSSAFGQQKVIYV
ncbi:hydrophobin [Trichoderma compactum]